VNSNTAEAAMPFNLPLVPTLSMQDYNPSRSTISNYSGGLQNYLIGTDGNITFPIIGKLHVDGMTKNALADLIKTKIYPRYIRKSLLSPFVMPTSAFRYWAKWRAPTLFL